MLTIINIFILYVNNKVKGAVDNDTSPMPTEVQKQKQPDNRV